MKQSEFIVGIDIGTTKIVALAGRLNEFGKVEIISMGKAESLGVKRGVVANIDKTTASIIEAVQEALSKADIDIRSAHVGIAGQHIRSLQHRGVLVRDNFEQEISERDILKLKEQMYKLILPPGDRIIHVLPQDFIIDNEQGIKDPVGMAGARLEANFHMITGQITAAKNIQRCVNRANIEIEDLILEPLASAEAVLSKEEMEGGVALVDIGGGTTDIAIFYDGIIRHTAVIPFGGDIITNDIREGCRIMKNQAEKLKCDYGIAWAKFAGENEIVSIPRQHGRPHREISVRMLSEIIQARMEEILNQVRFEIKASGFDKKLISGIVLTGGGSKLKHIVPFANFITSQEARVGLPNEYLAKNNEFDISHPMYATAVGLIMKGAQASQDAMQLGRKSSPNSIQKTKREPINFQPEETPIEMVEEKKEKKSSWLKNIFNTKSLKKWFEDDDYVDFE